MQGCRWASRTHPAPGAPKALVSAHQFYRYRRSFYIHSIFHSHFHLACPADERYSLVMLIEAGHITQRRLAEAYGFDADTINNWVQRYREFGAAGLLRSNPSNLKPVPKAEGVACAQPSRLQQACLELA